MESCRRESRSVPVMRVGKRVLREMDNTDNDAFKRLKRWWAEWDDSEELTFKCWLCKEWCGGKVFSKRSTGDEICKTCSIIV